MNDKHVMITISRQFGTNGREIGRVLAEYLDIGYYNKELMAQIANDMKIDPSFFEENNLNDAGFFRLSKRTFTLSTMAEISVNSELYEKSCELIQGIAQRESAVIVGRCADYILRDHPNVIRVFCYSDRDTRIKVAMNAYGVPFKKVDKFVDLQDQKRSGFYEFYTNQKWGQPANYDLMINTSTVSLEEAVKLLAHWYDYKMGVESIKGAFMDQYLNEKKVDLSEESA
ncbi:AAA family ATPase [Absicoccus intestinalis]|uniref:Cytidylate kinase-like family protein n=1 Tax=Absicoccus intestinalis TaxID=2926319 RepID=A0ABU4WNU3_9FIRM|nr:cytidylate kinase-like family protein [Absicoccus sp. CLA-KB-P134]MDX8418237.1 cytidylate kinase-like family protein [Absicoccus sp. CLA-KB-P134]